MSLTPNLESTGLVLYAPLYKPAVLAYAYTKTRINMPVPEVIRFGLVGIINTLIDFGIFNALTSKRIRFSHLKANLTSTTVAMSFSFFANELYVFKSGSGNIWLKIGLFLLVTTFGLYVLQNLTIFTLTKKWKLIPNLAVKFVHRLGLGARLSDKFIIKNTAKATATIVSLTWNFILFKYVVFPK